jgi:hypothetical protein
MTNVDTLYEEGIGGRNGQLYDASADGRPDSGRIGSFFKMLMGEAIKKGAQKIPEWKATGLLPEIYTAYRGGIREAAEQYAHMQGNRTFKLPGWAGFQNLYPIMKFGGGSTDISRFYTFRRSDTGRETPIEYESQHRGPRNFLELAKAGEGSVDREDVVGSNTIQHMLGPKNQRGEFYRALCLAEITDMDEKRVKSPEQFAGQYAAYEVFLGGQIGERVVVQSTPSGDIIQYEMPTRMDKLKTYTRLDWRYTMRSMPIRALRFEDMPLFKGASLQRMTENIVDGTIKSEMQDQVSGYNAAGRPLRADGYLNPISRYM